MVTRRRFLQGMAAFTAVGQLGSLTALAAGVQRGLTAPASGLDTTADGLARYVNVFVGTGGHGHTYPGATRPFGMVQLSPDTYNAQWDGSSGYHQGDGSIMGFSHTHLSGTGASDMLDVLVMPSMGPVRLQPGDRDFDGVNYVSRFDGARPGAGEQPKGFKTGIKGYRSHYTGEHAQPGYYRAQLTAHDILAELTATLRAGIHRYTFAKDGDAHLLIDMTHGFQDDMETPTKVSDVELKLVGNDTLVGGRRVYQWASGRVIYFAMKVSRPIASATLYENDKALAKGTRSAKGDHLKAALHFDKASSEPLLVKVGISGVDIEGAMRNLDGEIPGWDFDGVRADAEAEWERELSRIQIASSSDKIKRTFYSSLYHTMLAPTVFSDIDGRYRGMDRAVHTLPEGRHNYSTYSLWDTYRAEHPLFTLYQSERVPDLVDGLVRLAVESPSGAPVWPLQGVETVCMIGYHSAVVVAEAQAKGFTGIDYAKAWPVFRRRATQDDYFGLPYYRKLGFIPSDKEGEAASKTLEYAYDDWAVAHMAEALGHGDDAALLRKRSQNYRNVFDNKTNFVRPRAEDGTWLEPFDPVAIGHSDRWRDFTESNAWQATFLNQHDVYNYMTLFGGEQAFEEKLDGLFNADPRLPKNAPPDIAGMVGQYAFGNEPGHHMPYLYAYAGAHHKTQARVRMLLETMYLPEPDGLPGNEDCGQMSAWYVMSAMGLYAVDPVSTNYVFGSPLLDRAEVQVGGGRTLVIETTENGEGRPYIQSVTWNGKPWTKSWIPHKELTAGGTLSFVMGDKPNEAFGKAPSDRPPSFV
ncbi:putative alpha-1,2-mannosidase [Luteibacter rhizovicinus]|uniref:Putative alpha-1,2-mannosidase n=1 Tax=Luteibacter rhizovicinus TaxID=242606 RepID=A0A4V6P435_9GAMM|nr:GH92 family glycosyl hydrolase [Luteibacter rhizovicinus]TCV93179.1 putative alpha-1,2-mannosidase [Luteibacter rhizovicinus]